MPTATLFELVEALADQIRGAMNTATDGTDLRVQVEPLRVFQPTPPTIDMYPADPFRTDETAGMGDVAGAHRFTVRARVDTADTDAGQQILYDLLDDEHDLCLARALLDDHTLGGLAYDLRIDAFTGQRMYVDPGDAGAYLGVEWTVSVLRAYS